MRITSLEYTRRFNMGPYEHEEIKIGAAIDETDNTVASIAEVKNTVLQGRRESFGQTSTAASEPVAAAPAPVKESKPKSKAEKAPKQEAPAKEPDNADSEAAEQDASSEQKVAEAPAEAAPAEAKKKTVRKVGTPYDRNNELHKKLVGQLLDKEFPKWRTEPTKAKQVSQELMGIEFLDPEGLPVASFIAALKAKMTA